MNGKPLGRRENTLAAVICLMLGLLLLHIFWGLPLPIGIIYGLSAVAIFFIWSGISGLIDVLTNETKPADGRAGLSRRLLDSVAQRLVRHKDAG